MNKQASSPLLTACIPVYNHVNYVGAAIESILAQTYHNIELIIINDGSKDESATVVEKYLERCEKRFVRFKFVNRENKGLTNTLNEALKWGEGKYFAALASDDEWLPAKTATQIEYLERHTQAAGVFSGVEFMNEDGTYIRTKTGRAAKCCFEDIFLLKESLPAPSHLLRMTCMRENGGFDPSIKIEDWFMWLKITESGTWTLDRIPDVLAKYRRHGTNTSTQHKLMADEQRKILSKYCAHPLYRAAKRRVALLQFNGVVVHSKRAALSILPDVLGLWRQGIFWKAIAKLALPQALLARKYG
jgi:alpha-1,3-rhamnosyltransferase